VKLAVELIGCANLEIVSWTCVSFLMDLLYELFSWLVGVLYDCLLVLVHF